MAKRKRLLGRLLYTFFLLLWAVLLCYGAYRALDEVWVYAEAYEASRPNHTMDAYVAELSQNLWSEGIADTVKAMPHEAQSDEEVATRVREMLSNGISYVRKGGGGEGRAVYGLRCGGREFGSVTLTEVEDYVSPVDLEKLPWRLIPWSIRPWRVESESFDFNGLYSSVEVVVPKTYSVWLNGVQLGRELVVEENIPFDVLRDYYERYDGLPTKLRYRFDNVIGTIDPEIRDEDGMLFRVDPTRDDSQFIRPCSPEKLERLAQFTTGFVDRYLKFTSGAVDPTAGYQRLGPYLLKGSDLDGRMHDAIDGLTWAHTETVTVDAATLNGALSLGDGFYILDISAEATTSEKGKGETKNTTNMRVIVRERNDDIRAITLELY